MSPHVLDCWNSMVRAVQNERDAIEEARRWAERHPDEAEAAARAVYLWQAAAPCMQTGAEQPTAYETEAALQRLLDRLG